MLHRWLGLGRSVRSVSASSGPFDISIRFGLFRAISRFKLGQQSRIFNCVKQHLRILLEGSRETLKTILFWADGFNHILDTWISIVRVNFLPEHYVMSCYAALRYSTKQGTLPEH